MFRKFLATFAALFLLAWTTQGLAAPEAHILRIDPRAGVDNGKPIITMVVEVVQMTPLTTALEPCASETGLTKTLNCWATELEKPGALYKPIEFPAPPNSRLLVDVDGSERLVKYVDKVQWKDAASQPNVGTAWLISLDASAGMGSRYNDARQVAMQFIEAMGPNDLMQLMIFDDRQVVRKSNWKTFKDRNSLVTDVLNQQPNVMPSNGRDRPLFAQIKDMTRDAFQSLGNWDAPDKIPLHQAMVVLSNGAGRGDAASASPSAEVFHKYMNEGRFPEENKSLPKTPLPVISIWFPNKGGGLISDLYKNNDAQFMRALANVEIGGFFSIVQEGQATTRGKTIVDRVKERFGRMWIVRWKLACLRTGVTQSFNLVFENTKPLIAPDGTFKDIPLGINPVEWPLDIDVDKTVKEAQANPVHPDGEFNVYGDFCWDGNKERVESYFVEAGMRATPSQMKSRDPEVAKNVAQQLKSKGLVGTTISASETYVTVRAPDNDKFLEGSGENMVARIFLYDNKAKRVSSVDEKTVLTLKASKKPLNLLLILGIAGGVIVILLLVLVLFKGGGSKRRGGAAPPPNAPPPYGGGGYGGGPYGGGGYGGAPPGGGYGGAPPGGGYGGPPGGGYAGGGGHGGGYHAQDLASPVAAPPHMPVVSPNLQPAPPPVSNEGQSEPPPVVQIRCPSCGMTTMATAGQPSVCFSCGQPIAPARVSETPGFPLTGGMPVQALEPPPNPYGGTSPFDRGGGPTAATILGPGGPYSIREGDEVRVGRDPGLCPIHLSEPRISGVHGTLKFERRVLWVRDETSNNGVFVGGVRLSPGIWTEVPSGSVLRFGPVEFRATLEA